jgi:hypothetical protein
MLAAPNAFAMLGGPITVMVAVLLVAPGPLSVDETGPVVLFCTPAAMPCTFTLTLQLAFAANVAPVRLIEPDPAAAVTVPVQVVTSPFGVATCRPAGSVSLNATPVSPRLELGLLSVKVTEVVAFSRMLDAPKALVMVGGAATLRFAEAVLPVPPLVEVTLPVVLVYCPAAAPVTVTLNWHWLFAAIVAPESAIPVGAVVVSVPPQTVAEALATVSPVGSVSVNATPVSATAFAAGFVMVNVSDVVAFSAMFAGLNTLAIEGSATTLIEAEAVPPVPPSVEVTAPVVLFCVPAAMPVTLTEKVQEVLAARLAPDRLMIPVPAVALIVPPPQEPVRPFGVEITRPAGRVSLKPMPVRVVVLLGFWTMKLSEVEPFSGMLAAPKDLMMSAGDTTVMLALDVLPAPPSVEITLTLLFLTPGVVPWTFTDTVQLALAAKVPAERLMLPDPAVAVAVPPQVLFKALGVATTKPSGKLSVKAIPVRARLVFGLVILKVSEVVPFSGICAAPNALVIAGGVATVRLAEAVLPVPPFVEVTFPVVFVNCPEAAPVTVTLN